MINMKHILVAVDFGTTSELALDFGRTLADACGASLHLFHVISHPVIDGETVQPQRRAATARLEALLDRADRERRHATVACEAGTPSHEIARYVRDHGIDLVVMGTHSHGPTFRMLTGSIAEAVMGAVPCAVLTVKGCEASPSTELPDPAVAASGAQ